MQRNSPPLRLRTWLVVLLSTALILPTLLWGLVYSVGLGSVSRGIILDNLKQRGDSHAQALASQLYLPWRHVSYLAGTLDLADPEALREFLTHTVEADRRYLWLGVARTDGRVMASSSGNLEGIDVSGRDWFYSGLRKQYAGGPHADEALAQLLPRRSDAYSFFAYAAPIRNADGRVVGVLGAYFDWSQLRSSLVRFASDQAETLLIERNGKVLIGPQALIGQQLTPENAITQAQADPSLRISTWDDGVSYVSISIPSVVYADMPSPGFSLIVRQEAEQAFQPLRKMMRHFWHAVGLGALLMLAVIIALSWWVAAPISKFAKSANDLANGHVSPPPEHHAYHEAEQFSTALTRLQCRIGAVDSLDPPASDLREPSASTLVRS